MKTIFFDLINTWLQPGGQKPQNNGNGFNRFRRRAISGGANVGIVLKEAQPFTAAPTVNPEGIESFSPAVRGTSYAGSIDQKIPCPERVAQKRLDPRPLTTSKSAVKSRFTFHVSHISAIVALFVTAIIFLARPSHASNYTAHEWGTFTSVQGGDGNLLSWHPLQSSELPKFVYSTKFIPFAVSKTGLVTLQRLETPVIYFYAKEPMKVDVDVSFPKGFITEWYPQLTTLNPTHTVMDGNAVQTESRAIWRDLDIFPDIRNALQLGTNQLPQDTASSHYFAARDTSANLVRAHIATNNSTELEKFIFYRGAGSFQTPLRVTLDTNSIVTVENTGAQPLAHLFLLNIHDGRGAFAVLDELASSNSVHWQQLSDTAGEHWNRFDLPQFKTQIASQVQAALVSTGLYADEAEAMVNTWRDSWFTEDGVRVLYLLPRPWTDEILPLTLTPRPSELTRVMVGRAEVVTTQTETKLFQLMSTAQTGDTNAQAQAVSELKHLGRFAGPAMQLAMSHTTNSTLITFSYQLYSQQQSTSPKFE